MCDGKIKIDIKLKGAPPSLNLGGSLAHDDEEGDAVPLQNVGRGEWTVCLDPGDYAFVCNVRGQAGPAGTVTVVDQASKVVLISVPDNKIDVTPGTIGRIAILAPFTVPAPDLGVQP